ncbi:copper transporter [Jatrophihabitans telluris]|uniref:Copper transporter n=1 Tax=Jatrophihabitans telluris TaxID=2038343 RepID=A0ABY4R492_9ACTN|nr:copper transporter [Jatrophihabitans telluris]UQX90118.1 copper transporter [Jatrophihabitans telluris]
MISFRYHIVSIIGIFLAIALGVVIGASALNGAVVGDLRRQVSDLKNQNAAQTSSNTTLRAQAGNADQLAHAFAGKIAGGALTKKTVVILGAPGASSTDKDAAAAAVASAGGQVTARLQLSKTFIDPQHATDIRSLATNSGVHPVGLQLPQTDNAGTLSGSLLGFVLFGKGQATDLTQVLAGFSGLAMVKVEQGTPASGSLLLLVAPGAVAGDSSGPMLLAMAKQLQATGPTVVLGDATSARNGLIALIRGDTDAKAAVSTVDDADSDLGQLTTALVAAEAAAGRPGQFGTGANVDALLPGVDG